MRLKAFVKHVKHDLTKYGHFTAQVVYDKKGHVKDVRRVDPKHVFINSKGKKNDIIYTK